jgi:hypothetical protein
MPAPKGNKFEEFTISTRPAFCIQDPQLAFEIIPEPPETTREKVRGFVEDFRLPALALTGLALISPELACVFLTMFIAQYLALRAV